VSWRVDILGALRTRLLTVPGLNAWQPVLYANRELPENERPTSETPHIRETTFLTSSDDASIGEAVRWREIVGTWQLMLCVLTDADIFPAQAFADALEVAFLIPSLALPGGDALRISTVTVGTPRPANDDDPFIRVPVVFTFTVLTHT
jgi:hypothetical protein